jgi:hypothetical protein
VSRSTGRSVMSDGSEAWGNGVTMASRLGLPSDSGERGMVPFEPIFNDLEQDTMTENSRLISERHIP